MTLPSALNVIRTQRCPDCYLCGTPGNHLYQGLSDRLYRAPGTWDLKRCPNPHCGLVWLDPMPLEEDMFLAYRDYFTHASRPTVQRGVGRTTIHWLYRALLWITRLGHQRRELRGFYLRGTPPGRLLEVGCGDGGQLAWLRTMGWQVEGQEVDPAAAEQARFAHGLHMHLGALADLKLGGGAFDAITMSHVIEHVHHPVSLLKECRRLLKCGGTLVAVTPNINSFGHDRFGADWRGLERPRHLHLFSPKTLRVLAARAGFVQQQCWTTAANAQFLGEASLKFRQNRQCTDLEVNIQALLFQFQAMVAHSVHKDSGEKCVLKAMKTEVLA